MLQSMSRKANCYDNAVMESFFHAIKSELIRFEEFQTRDEAKMKVFEYIEIFYNRQRSHSSIGYCSPYEFENNLKIKLVA
jgi:transposase InsO family protein